MFLGIKYAKCLWDQFTISVLTTAAQATSNYLYFHCNNRNIWHYKYVLKRRLQRGMVRCCSVSKWTVKICSLVLLYIYNNSHLLLSRKSQQRLYIVIISLFSMVHSNFNNAGSDVTKVIGKYLEILMHPLGLIGVHKPQVNLKDDLSKCLCVLYS